MYRAPTGYFAAFNDFSIFQGIVGARYIVPNHYLMRTNPALEIKS